MRKYVMLNLSHRTVCTIWMIKRLGSAISDEIPAVVLGVNLNDITNTVVHKPPKKRY